MNQNFMKDENTLSLNKYKIPLFDVDWTLLRGKNPAHLDAFDFSIHTVYKLPDKASIRNHTHEGKIDSQILMELAQEFGVSEEESKAKVQDAMTAVVDYFMKHISEGHYDLMLGVKELLEELKSLGIPLGLLTGNIEEIGWKKMELAGIREYFTFGAFGSLAFKRPDLIPIAKQRLDKILNIQIPLENFVIIGDSPLDIACARAVNIQVIAVATGDYKQHHLAEADLVVNSLEEKDKIIDFLKLLPPR